MYKKYFTLHSDGTLAVKKHSRKKVLFRLCVVISALYRSAQHRFEDAEHHVCDDKGYEDIERLCRQKSIERFAVLARENILESRFQTYADECDAEQCVAQPFGGFAYRFGPFPYRNRN